MKYWEMIADKLARDGWTYGASADAQIGAVKVGGAWAASSLVAGVTDTGADGFGNFFDLAIAGGNANIVSRIASITISKLAISTPESLAPADHFGFGRLTSRHPYRRRPHLHARRRRGQFHRRPHQRPAH